MAGIGAFFGGLADGYGEGTNLKMRKEAEARAKRESDLRIEQGQFELDEKKRAKADEAAMYGEMAGVLGGQPVRQEVPGLKPIPAEAGDGGGDAAGAGASVAPGLARADTGPVDPAQKIGFSIYQNPDILKDPARLKQLADIAIKYRSPQTLQWLQAASKASDEGLYRALIAAQSGDLATAERDYNASGQGRVKPGSLGWVDQKSGILGGVGEDGRPFEINVATRLRGLLSPADYVKQVGEDRKIALHEREVVAKENDSASQGRLRAAQEDLARAQAEYARGAKTALTNAQAGKAERSGAGAPDANQRARISRSISIMVDDLTKPTLGQTVDGKATKTAHELEPFKSDIASEAERLIFDEGEDGNRAVQFAKKTVEERVAKVNGLLDVAMDGYSKTLKAPFWGQDRDGAMKALRSGIDAMLEDGVPADVIKRVAKSRGADAKVIDEALRSRGTTSASGRVRGGGESAAKAPASGGGYSNLWN